MKNLLYLAAGAAAAAAAYLLITQNRGVRTGTTPRRDARPLELVPSPVDQLAHRLEDAWADHHTVA